MSTKANGASKKLAPDSSNWWQWRRSHRDRATCTSCLRCIPHPTAKKLSIACCWCRWLLWR